MGSLHPRFRLGSATVACVIRSPTMPKQTRSGVTINHASVYAREPERAAALAALTGGAVAAFHPCDGAWVCFLRGDGDWEGPLIEFYPRSVALGHEEGRIMFRENKSDVTGAGTHFNLTVPVPRAALEARCKQLGVVCAWRDWQELLDVWLEPELLIECVPQAAI